MYHPSPYEFCPPDDDEVGLSRTTQEYLEEVFGYSSVSEIDALTLECIQENARDGFPADKEIVKAYQQWLDSH
jgi:hypothetical protein